MDNLLKIRLRALNIDLNHDREYRIILGQDLFSNWYVVVMFGKYGTGLETKPPILILVKKPIVL